MRATVEERFWAKVDKGEGGCMEWSAARLPKGYGLFRYEGKIQQAHRVSWKMYKGPIPEGMCVCHTCDNPKCINPDHLFLATNLENHQDKASKGRTKNGNSYKTHCIHGHAFTEENTGITGSGNRYCRSCDRQHSKNYQETQKGR